MKVSVLTAVDGHAQDSGEWFESLCAQTLSADCYEVIVVDENDDAQTRHAFERLNGNGGPRIVYEGSGRPGRAAALNQALDHAHGDLFVFLADDFVPTPEFLERHLRFHERHPEPEHVGIGDAHVPEELLRGPFTRWLESSGAFFGIPFPDGDPAVPEDFFYVGNSSVKRPLLEAAGRFDEDFPYHAWEDHELGLRLRAAGMRSSYAPGTRAAHAHPVTLRERGHQTRQAGESAAILERKRPGPHGWKPRAQTPPWRWRAAALKWKLGHLVTRREELRERFYDRWLAAAFAAGYRRGRSRGPSQTS